MNKNNYWYKSVQILKLFKNKSFVSWNCGLNSTERKNLKRVSDVIEALHTLNQNNIKNESSDFFDQIRMAIIGYMEASGYKHSINNNDKTVFKKVKK